MVFHAYPDDTDNLDVRKVIAKQIILHFYQYSEDFNFFFFFYIQVLLTVTIQSQLFRLIAITILRFTKHVSTRTD